MSESDINTLKFQIIELLEPIDVSIIDLEQNMRLANGKILYQEQEIVNLKNEIVKLKKMILNVSKTDEIKLKSVVVNDVSNTKEAVLIIEWQEKLTNYIRTRFNDPNRDHTTLKRFTAILQRRFGNTNDATSTFINRFHDDLFNTNNVDIDISTNPMNPWRICYIDNLDFMMQLSSHLLNN